MDWLAEGLLGLISPDVSRRTPASMRPRSIERTARELRGKLDQASAAGEPLICELPASLRIIRSPRPRGIRFVERDEATERMWKPGMLHLDAAALTWTPLDGHQGTPQDLTTATDIRETPLRASRDPNRATWKMTMRVGPHHVELVVRRSLLPFARAALQQIATTSQAKN